MDMLVTDKPSAVPLRTREAVARSVRIGLESLRALPPMTLSEWATRHFILAGDSSHQRGAWQPWPFQPGIMDAMSNDDIYEVDVIKSKRVGYTKILTASIGFDAAHRRRNQALWQPTDDDRDSFVKSEVEPMIAAVEAVAAARRLTRGVQDTIKYKQFRDSVLHLLGGKAARAYRRITVASAKLDELDGFDQQIEKSADPVTLAEGRLEGAPFPKLILGSTPRLKGFSHTEHRAQLADAFMRYHITCIHCGLEHPLVFGGKRLAHGFKWERGQPDTVRHVCPHCRQSITQADYLAHWTGAWVCDKTGMRYGSDKTWRSAAGDSILPPRHVAFHIWTAYSPQRDWPDIVRQVIAAATKMKAGDSAPMQGFVNEVLGETWEEECEHTDADVLAKRAKAECLPVGLAPRGACLLVAGIDVQGDRWEMTVWGVGRGMETWAIDSRVVFGNTAEASEWESKVEPLIGLTYPHASGATLALSAVAIDTGHQTHAAYAFCRKHARAKVYAVKGDGELGKPIKARRSLMDVNERGRKIRKGVALWHVGTDTAKDLLHGRLQLDTPGPGYVHFAAGLPEAWFAQITAESRIPVRTTRGLEHRWQCPQGRRNEALDIAVYALFCMEMLDVQTWSDRVWSTLERALEPDLFSAARPDDQGAVEIKTATAQAPTKPASAAARQPAPAPRRLANTSGIASLEWSNRL